MAARALKRVKLTNPRRRKMTAKQIRFFGTKAQRAALKRRHTKATRTNPAKRRRKRNAPKPWSSLYRSHYAKKSKATKRTSSTKKRHNRSRRRNVGEIVSIGLAGLVNPKRGSMTRRKRNRKSVARRRKNPVANTYRRKRYTRRHNRRHSVRRRNPGMFAGVAQNVFGVIGGATATKLVSDRLPMSLTSGILGYISSAIVAVVLGFGVKKVSKSKPLGDAVMLGGFTYLGLKVLGDFLPSIGSISAIGLRGMGTIMPSGGFAVPAVNQPGSMTQFVTPGYLTPALPAADSLKGLNAGRRLARVR